MRFCCTFVCDWYCTQINSCLPFCHERKSQNSSCMKYTCCQFFLCVYFLRSKGDTEGIEEVWAEIKKDEIVRPTSQKPKNKRKKNVTTKYRCNKMFTFKWKQCWYILLSMSKRFSWYKTCPITKDRYHSKKRIEKVSSDTNKRLYAYSIWKGTLCKYQRNENKAKTIQSTLMSARKKNVKSDYKNVVEKLLK